MQPPCLNEWLAQKRAGLLVEDRRARGDSAS